MANETTPRNFKRQIILEKQGSKILVLNNKPEDSKCTIDSVNCQITLSQIEFVNEMYSPAHLTVKATLVRSVQQDSLNVQNKPSLPSYQSIVNFFLLAKASVQNEKSDLLESNFYVHEVRPTYVNNNSGNKVILYLDIYSADKLMTLDKYSKSYVDKSLYGGILATEAKRFYVGKDENNKYITVSTRDLSSRLKYREKDGDTPNIEIKHPYLVQYNESFYDFLIRTANRTGEFLYFAGGQLTLGVNAGANVTTVGKYNSLAVESRNNSVLSTTGISHNYSVKLEKTKKHEKSSSGLRYTQPTSNDDYLLVYTKDEFDKFSDEYKADVTLPAGAFKTLLTTTTIGAFVKALLVDLVAIEMTKANNNASTVNEDYNKKVFKTDNSDEIAEHAKTVFTGTYREKYIDNWYVNANADFYNKIDECEKKMGSRTITLTLKGDGGTNYQVGQLIEVEGSKYVVTHVNYSEIFDGHSMRYEHIIKALPLLNVKVDENTHKATLLLTDESSTSEQDLLICCPAALPEEKRIRKAASQIAWVEDSDDPKYLGRVRIRYAWDADGDSNASPWISQAEPAAGKGGGVNFRLYKDDEVMIGYENDNIEQPYIIGALYHGDEDGLKNGVPVGRNKKAQNTHLIRNKSGHQMVISEMKNNSKFLTSMNPALTLLNTLAPGAINWIHDDVLKMENPKEGSVLAGGFQFNDKYGIYNVSMSSDQRLISIASPFGNIKLSAFSGISISAPRGDISISGKNVSIKADNKLTIESGSNAKNTEFTKTWNETGKLEAIGSAVGQGALEGLSSFVSSLVDLSLVRHIMECFVAPVDGTLQIKSHRYLLLEAGKGSAHIPQNLFEDANNAANDLGRYNKYYGGSNKAVKMKIHIEKLAGMVTQTSHDYQELLKQVKDSATGYTSAINKRKQVDNEDRYPSAEVAYNALKNHVGEKKFKGTFLVSGRALLFPTVEASASSYWNAIKELDRYVKTFNKRNWAIMPYLNEAEFGIALTNAINKFKESFSNLIVVPNSHADISSKEVLITADNIIRLVRSEVIFAYLTTLRDTKPVSILKGTNNRGLSNNVPISPADWTEFMNNLQFNTPDGFSKEAILGEPADNFIKNTKKNFNFWSTYAENKNWGYDRAKHGRILFSDQDNNTYYVDSVDKRIESEANPNIGQIRDSIIRIIFPDYRPPLA